jgi:hypothetical protein
MNIKNLIGYLNNRKDILNNWIENIKKIHRISPKSTIIQGKCIK